MVRQLPVAFYQSGLRLVRSGLSRRAGAGTALAQMARRRWSSSRLGSGMDFPSKLTAGG